MRQKERRQAKKDDEINGYHNYTWDDLYKSSNLKKLKFPELTKYTFHHNMSRRKFPATRGLFSFAFAVLTSTGKCCLKSAVQGCERRLDQSEFRCTAEVSFPILISPANAKRKETFASRERRKMSKSEKRNRLSTHISKGQCERISTLNAAETAAVEAKETQDDVSISAG